MRTILIATAVAALAAGAAFAHEHGGRGEHLFRADSNNDGAVTRAEFDQARGAMFTRIDADHDGQLERGEHRRGHHGEHMAAADANHDGAISRDEFLARPLEMFARLDANSDGSISREEQTAAHSRHEEMREARHERGDRHREHLRAADADHDHQLSAQEFATLGDRMFEQLDANRDGSITRQEAEAHHGQAH
ncbi:MAG TPA: hypothetical protein DHW63_08970 [Hyphomonadaceae bacterium]|nr:hypothetical protein [Hyphomonadaceae bacterium]